MTLALVGAPQRQASICPCLPETPAFHEALHDRALRGPRFHVWLWCYENLDEDAPRLVKVGALAVELGMSRRTVFDAMAYLVAAGYTRRGDARQGHMASYCVNHARVAAQQVPVIVSQSAQLATA